MSLQTFGGTVTHFEGNALEITSQAGQVPPTSTTHFFSLLKYILEDLRSGLESRRYCSHFWFPLSYKTQNTSQVKHTEVSYRSSHYPVVFHRATLHWVTGWLERIAVIQCPPNQILFVSCRWTSDIIASSVATDGAEMKWSPTQKDLKPFQVSQVTWYIHFVQVTLVLKVFSFIHFLLSILFHHTLMNNFLSFLFYKFIFIQHQ